PWRGSVRRGRLLDAQDLWRALKPGAQDGLQAQGARGGGECLPGPWLRSAAVAGNRAKTLCHGRAICRGGLIREALSSDLAPGAVAIDQLVGVEVVFRNLRVFPSLREIMR